MAQHKLWRLCMPLLFFFALFYLHIKLIIFELFYSTSSGVSAILLRFFSKVSALVHLGLYRESSFENIHVSSSSFSLTPVRRRKNGYNCLYRESSFENILVTIESSFETMLARPPLHRTPLNPKPQTLNCAPLGRQRL